MYRNVYRNVNSISVYITVLYLYADVDLYYKSIYSRTYDITGPIETCNFDAKHAVLLARIHR